MLAEAPTIDISQSFAFFGLEQGVKQKTYKEAFRRYVKERSIFFIVRAVFAVRWKFGFFRHRFRTHY